jgi:hypothetical protein
MKNSKEIALHLNLPHKIIMEFYWEMENQIVVNRHFIDCTLVVEDNGENWVKDICESLEFAFYVKFNRFDLLNNNPF